MLAWSAHPITPGVPGLSSKQTTRSTPPSRQKPKPKPYAGNPQMQAAQEARREAAKQRQQVAQVAALRRKKRGRLQRTLIVAAIVLVVVGGITAYFVNEANKP